MPEEQVLGYVARDVGAALNPTTYDPPELGEHDVRISVTHCGVCHTDIQAIEDYYGITTFPFVPGHEIVGRVAATGREVQGFTVGDRVGVPWLGFTCGMCPYCSLGRENLCDRPIFTGYTRDGGYATHAVADARYSFPLPQDGDAGALAPLLCAGLIGWRSYRLASENTRLRSLGSWERRPRCMPCTPAARCSALAPCSRRIPWPAAPQPRTPR